MKSFNFQQVIETYEEKKPEVNDYEINNKSKDEINIIKNDVQRSFMIQGNLTDLQRNTLRKILYEILITTPVEYLQGMNDIASVIVYFYFSDELDELDENDSQVDFDLISQARVTLTNILKEKYEPVIANNFELYKKYNRVFIEMMKKRNRDIKDEESMKYMNNTITWFIRDMRDMENIYTLVGYMLSCPTSFPFLLLVRFFDQIEKKEEIKDLDENLYEQLIELETEFLETEQNMSKGKSKIGAKELIFAGAMGALALAVLYKVLKKDDYNNTN